MAKLIKVYRQDINGVKIDRRQLPLVTGDNMMMLMDLNSKGLVIDGSLIKGKELDEFSRKYHILSYDELQASLEVNSTDILLILSQTVQCVGCRRSVEKLFYKLNKCSYPTLDPIMIKSNGCLSINQDKIKTPQLLGTVLYKHKEILDHVMENKIKNKNTTRCVLHSRDALRSKLFSESWREIWTAMKQRCREELTVIETTELHEVLDDYLKKHKFCAECKTKVETAYEILVSDSISKETGFVAALYSNIRKCTPDNHIHIGTKHEFIDMLIHKAETEINGSFLKQRERHAKTIEIAQKEILTCIGIIIYERLKKIYVSLREEERACQVLAAVGIHALSRSFNGAVEKKQGISNLELCYQEISRADKAKELKREQRKLKKKKKKIEKKNLNKLELETTTFSCAANNEEEEEDEEEEEEEEEEEDDDNNHHHHEIHTQENECNKCIVAKSCPCENDNIVLYTKSIDGGYSSDPSHLNSRTSSCGSSLEGSEISGCDEICNSNGHQKGVKNFQIKLFGSIHINNNPCSNSNNLSLQQMLKLCEDAEEEDGKNSCIPDEVVNDFKCREIKIKQQRAELREKLQRNFDEMCNVITRENCKLTN